MATASVSASPAASKKSKKIASLNELASEWTAYNYPAGKQARGVRETKDQMTARYAMTDAWATKEMPDVLFLQELSLLRSDILAQTLNSKFYIFIANNQSPDGKLMPGGCAVLLRRDSPSLDVKEARGYPLVFKAQKPGTKDNRVALVVVAKLDGKETAFVSVHLEGVPTALGDTIRLMQACEAVDYARLKAPKAERIVMAGDFNQPLDSIYAIDYGLGVKGMYRVANSTPTFQEKEHVLDYMYVSSEQTAAKATCDVFPKGRTKNMPLPPYEWAEWGSDHSALIVNFDDL